ncbi:MAG: hypothetical protein AB1Z98_27685, partial [Nannocystaceae bacterium]
GSRAGWAGRRAAGPEAGPVERFHLGCASGVHHRGRAAGPEADTVVWLTVEMKIGAEPRSLVLGARVAWIDDEFIGLAFAGAPRRVQGRYASRRTRPRVGTSLSRER